jgi:hypothetical protein
MCRDMHLDFDLLRRVIVLMDDSICAVFVGVVGGMGFGILLVFFLAGIEPGVTHMWSK